MLDPKFLFISYTKSDIYITSALWDLECIKKVREWRKQCRMVNSYIDPLTGEIEEFNWYYIEKKANSYSLYDRCYRKGSKTPSTTSCPESGYNIKDANYYED